MLLICRNAGCMKRYQFLLPSTHAILIIQRHVDLFINEKKKTPPSLLSCYVIISRHRWRSNSVLLLLIRIPNRSRFTHMTRKQYKDRYKSIFKAQGMIISFRIIDLAIISPEMFDSSASGITGWIGIVDTWLSADRWDPGPSHSSSIPRRARVSWTPSLTGTDPSSGVPCPQSSSPSTQNWERFSLNSVYDP